MSTAPMGLKPMIEHCELHHPFFVEQLTPLERRVRNTLAGDIPNLEWLIGPSRVGKSMLMKALARAFPATRVDGRRRVEVLLVDLRSNISPLQMPDNVLRSLNVPRRRPGNAGDKFESMAEQLHLAGTRVILVGEASHQVEEGAKVLPSAAGDWWKVVLEDLNIGLVMSGVPRLERLLKSNGQLTNRAAARRVFRPYDYGVQAERDAFASCVKAFLNLFESAGYPIALDFELFVMHCYLVCAGRIGILSKYFYQLADDLCDDQPRPVTFADCAKAASRIAAVGHPSCHAFARDSVTLVELRQAYAYVMNDAGLDVATGT
jgi:hypothetical protein